jgi:ParB family chromosome partitioning protein
MSYRRYDFSNVGENKTRNLSIHPLNEKLYGESKTDSDLLGSIKENGIFNPIIVNKSKQILSGSRRWVAAKEAKFEKVPIITLLSDDYLLDELFLIESNRYRDKTAEQKGREFKRLKEIEVELAKQRQGTRTDLVETFPPSAAGKARDKAAAFIGMSGRQAEKLEKLVDKADKSPRIKNILQQVNAGEKSITKAFKEIQPQKKLSGGEQLAKKLSELFENGEVTRSREEGRFHLMLRNLSEIQIRNLAGIM